MIFVGVPPMHPHIYSNGYICLSILYDGILFTDIDWTPSLTTAKVCLSILSMLSSCKKKQRPANDASSVRYMSSMSPKKVNW